MSNNEKTYTYSLKLDVTGDKEVKKKLSSVSGYLDEYEKKMTEMYATPFEKAQQTTRFIEGNPKPAILTGIKNLDLLNLSLDRQIAEMLKWSKALGYVMPLLAKIHEEVKKCNRLHQRVINKQICKVLSIQYKQFKSLL